MLKKSLLFFFIVFSPAFAQVWGGGSGAVTSSANVTYMASGVNAKATDVQSALRHQIYADQYLSVQDAINAANGSTLIFPPGVYHCAGLAWGASMDVLVMIYQGANMLDCALPANDARHWILDWRSGNLNATQINGVQIQPSWYLLKTDVTGAIGEFKFPLSKYLVGTDATGKIAETALPASKYLLSTDASGHITGTNFAANQYLLKTDADGKIAATAFPANQYLLKTDADGKIAGQSLISKTILGTDGSGQPIESTHLADFDHSKIATAQQVAQKGAANGYAGLNANARFQTTNPTLEFEAATKQYVDNQISGLGGTVGAKQINFSLYNPDTYLPVTTIPGLWRMEYGTTVTLTNISCMADVANITIQVMKNTGTNTLSGNLTCGNNVWTQSNVFSTATLAVGDNLGLSIVSGNAHRVNVSIRYSVI